MTRHLRTLVGVGLSVLLLWWALRDVSAAEVAREVRRADPWLLTLAVALNLGGFLFRAVRWGIFLRPVVRGVPFRPRFAATMIGFAANNLLPARVGELARAYSLARLSAVPIAASLATLVLERILDGLTLVGLLFFSMGAPAFPVAADPGGIDPRSIARGFAIVMMGVAVALALLVFAPGPVMRVWTLTLERLVPARFRTRVRSALLSFANGLAILRDLRLFLLSVILALGQWLLTAVSFLVAFRAFRIDEVPLVGAVFLQSVVSLAVAIPSSPGFFGPFEAASKIGLGIWGVSPAKAVSFAVGFHIAGFIPVTLMGIYYVWRLGLRWSEVRHSDGAAEEQMEAGAPVPRGG